MDSKVINKTEIGKRIDDLLWRYRLNDKQLEVACGLASATIYKARHENRLTAETARRINSKFPEISIEWLLFGSGNMDTAQATAKSSLVESVDRLTAAIEKLTAVLTANTSANV